MPYRPLYPPFSPIEIACILYKADFIMPDAKYDLFDI